MSILAGRMIAALLALTLCMPAALAQETRAELTSPDGRIVFSAWTENGAPHYAIRFDGGEVVRPSRLGFRFQSQAPLEDAMAMTASAVSAHNASWEQPWGERRLVRDHHNERVFAFAHEDGRGFDLRVRVFDSGVGFRYEVSGSAPHAIMDELTRFNVPHRSEAWWIPAAGWNRYEYVYDHTPLSTVDRAHSPFTLRLPDDGVYVAIHEAALIDYSGFYLDQQRDGLLDIRLAPGPDGVAVHCQQRGFRSVARGRAS